MPSLFLVSLEGHNICQYCTKPDRERQCRGCLESLPSYWWFCWGRCFLLLKVSTQNTIDSTIPSITELCLLKVRMRICTIKLRKAFASAYTFLREIKEGKLTTLSAASASKSVSTSMFPRLYSSAPPSPPCNDAWAFSLTESSSAWTNVSWSAIGGDEVGRPL